MTLEGFVEYKRREFCKDIKCPVQMQLNSLTEASSAYEQTRQKCSSRCLYTTWQFHHWLIEKGYILLVSSKLKKNEQTVLANIDKQLIAWIDQQVQSGKFTDRSQLVASAITLYKKNQEKSSGDKSEK
jgi:hypothetical protein